MRLECNQDDTFNLAEVTVEEARVIIAALDCVDFFNVEKNETAWRLLCEMPEL